MAGKKLIALKAELYSELLKVKVEDLSTKEVDILYALSKDWDIQKLLEKNKNEKKH